jgi:hypothetical protein
MDIQLILIVLAIFVFLLLSGVGIYFFFRKEKDKCEGVKCLNKGKCVDGECKCKSGFEGESCEISETPDGQSQDTPDAKDPDAKDPVATDPVATNPCLNVNCGNFGTCVSGKCECKSGYTGEKCEKHPDLCLNVNCGNFGTCVSGKCECKSGYTGEKCEKPPLLNQPWQCVDNTNVPVRYYKGDIQCISTGTPKQCYQYDGRTICESEVSKLSPTATPGYTCSSEDYNKKDHWCSLAKDSFSKMSTVNHPWQCVDNTNVPVRSRDGKIQCISTLNNDRPKECYQYDGRSICETELSKLLLSGKATTGVDCENGQLTDKDHWCYWAKDSFDRMNRTLST